MVVSEFIGHLHPLIVHLPIGILFFAFVLMLVQYFRKTEMESAISLALLLGAISAVAACVAGWFLAQSGDYDTDLVIKHQWTGIASAVFGFLAYFIQSSRWPLAIITIATVSIAGHFGGSLTHGEDFLSLKKENTDSLKSVEKDSAAVFLDTTKTATNTNLAQNVHPIIVYQDLVKPILKKKCYNCHSSIKKKGGLRLDSEAFILKGGKNGKILQPKNPSKSPLFSNLILPLDHDDHMPPKGKTQLSSNEIATIQNWIKNGASFTETIENLPVNQPIIQLANVESPILTNDVQPTKATIANTEAPQMKEATNVDNKVAAVSPEVLAKLKKQNIVITDMSGGANHLTANFVNIKNYQTALLDDLKGIDNQLFNLKLSNLPVNDDDVKKIASFKNLTRLNLEKTAITDESLKHLKDLQNLEQLNLYGTNITDKGLESLAKYSKLRVIYLWQTKATAAGIEQLKKALPTTKIETGDGQLK